MTWRERADRLRALPLAGVLRVSGARPDAVDPSKWHTPRGVLSVTGTKFFNWTQDHGGGGAIDLVMHLHTLGFGQALEWLETHVAPIPIQWETVPSSSALRLPQPVPHLLPPIRDYLIHQRRLPAQLIDSLIQEGSLYADARANVVFLLRGPDREPVGAELRGTGALAWRGMAPGSRKDRGFFSVPFAPFRAWVLCESAIDAVSCYALHPSYRCLSTAGARPDPAWLPALLAEGVPVYCGFDLDPTGETMAQAMIQRHPTVQRLRPSAKDWNQVLVQQR